MEIAFDNRKLREVCENAEVANVEFGTAVVKMLQSRLADIMAVSNVLELITGNPKQMEELEGGYQVDLYDGYRLCFCANHAKVPTLDDKINWAEVSRVKLLKIEIEK